MPSVITSFIQQQVVYFHELSFDCLELFGNLWPNLRIRIKMQFQPAMPRPQGSLQFSLKRFAT